MLRARGAPSVPRIRLPRRCLCLRLPPSSRLGARIRPRDVPRTHPTLPVRDAPGFPNNWCGCRAEHLPSLCLVCAPGCAGGRTLTKISTGTGPSLAPSVLRLDSTFFLTLPARLPRFRLPDMSGRAIARGGACACMFEPRPSPSVVRACHCQSSMPKWQIDITWTHAYLPPRSVICVTGSHSISCVASWSRLSIVLTRHPDRGLLATFWVNLLVSGLDVAR